MAEARAACNWGCGLKRQRARTAVDPRTSCNLQARCLDLYGEDIRGRAYRDPATRSGARQMLRPDFTVPVVQMHMSRRRRTRPLHLYRARCSARQEESTRIAASEYFQVGYEVFRPRRPHRKQMPRSLRCYAKTAAVAGCPLRAATGDIGICFWPQCEGLKTTDRRKAALLRHIWRPRRFRALLDRYRRTRTAAGRSCGKPAVCRRHDPMLGCRRHRSGCARRPRSQERIEALREDAAAAPICGARRSELLETIFWRLRETIP